MTAFRLDDRTCLITAAGQGIGRATALAFAGAGARVIATDLKADLLEALAAEAPGIETRVLDVLDGDAIARTADAVGAVDVLFNCAGFVHHGTILDAQERDWDFSFDLNVKAMYRVTRAFLPAMLAAGGGTVLCMSSVVSSLKAAPNRFVYGATKAAVIGFVKALAVDFIRQGLRANAICPGTIDTPSLGDRIQAQGGDVEAVRQAFVNRQPMGRLGTAQEIAGLCLYLASDEARFVTGQTFVIDGGFTL